MKTFVSADHHFGHSNILKFTDRGKVFKNIQQHDEELIKRWNGVVGSDDEVYYLGDIYGVKFHKNNIINILNRLNGKIYYIKGNHDKENKISETCFKERFEWIKHYHEMEYNNSHLVMFHFPIKSWNRKHHGSIHLHAHSHGKDDSTGRIFDVGVDNPLCNYAPILLDDVVDRMVNVNFSIIQD